MTASGPLRDNVDFRRYWVGQLASDLGSQLSLVAYPLLVLALGGTAAQAGAVATGSLATRLVCRLPAGLLVDRFDRRTVMLAADLVRAAALGTIPLAALSGGPSYPQLLLVAIVEGAATSAFRPAAVVSIRQLVPPDQLTDAMARSQARVAVVTLIGPALGGFLFTVSRFVPFLADACSYLVSAAQISRIRTPLRAERSAGRTDRRLLAGLRWLSGQRVLRNVLGFAGVLNMVGVSAVLATVVTAKEHGASGTTVGLMLAGVGAGGLLGTAIAPRLVRWCPGPVLFAGVGLGQAGALTVLMAASSPWIVGPALASAFVLSPAAGIVVSKAMLLCAPGELQGRVAVAADLLISGLAATGPLVTGILLGGVGQTMTWLILAGASAAATLACLPTLRTPGFLSGDGSTISTTTEDSDVHVRQPR